eukprot:NODE_2910_length_846_cov_91.250941_g2409_i0.p1 GENE.NODE_2910_length_846_cov_91.250941_g2409_i0~~NODE_2910_length_846_cov_91.250941_g2409_i0.p1  ORF type:complete len:117 (-),score=10.32 NODE_2910_length_846_cov_91.250941_g2409_i0:304-654(-)
MSMVASRLLQSIDLASQNPLLLPSNTINVGFFVKPAQIANSPQGHGGMVINPDMIPNEIIHFGHTYKDSHIFLHQFGTWAALTSRQQIALTHTFQFYIPDGGTAAFYAFFARAAPF